MRLRLVLAAYWHAYVDPARAPRTEHLRMDGDLVLEVTARGDELVTRVAGTGQPVELPEAERRELAQLFPPVEGLELPAWVRSLQAGYQFGLFASDCARPDDDHLEAEILELVPRLARPTGVLVQVGRFQPPDDPMLRLAEFQPPGGPWAGLCVDCAPGTPAGFWADAQQVPWAGLSGHAAELGVKEALGPSGGVADVLRIDLPGGQSCQAAARLLDAGVRPQLLLLVIAGQVPPPLRFAPLGGDWRLLYSCSLSYATHLLGPRGYLLSRFSGAYAAFWSTEALAQAGTVDRYPIDEGDCYRKSKVFGYEPLPVHHVREWAVLPPDLAVERVWANITAHTGGNAPFTLALH